VSFDTKRKADFKPSTTQAVEPNPQALRVSKPSFEDQEYSRQTELMKNDITSFVAEGRDIRNEVEGLIRWKQFMGEGSGSPKWGRTQQECADHSIQTQRARLAKLRAAIEAKRPDAAEIIDYIFSSQNRTQHPEQITKQARTRTCPQFGYGHFR
jgi:hypothetical protein